MYKFLSVQSRKNVLLPLQPIHDIFHHISRHEEDDDQWGTIPAEQQRVEQITKIVEMFRQIINEDDAVENGFYLDGLPPQSLDGMRSWLWNPPEHILEPEEARTF